MYPQCNRKRWLQPGCAILGTTLYLVAQVAHAELEVDSRGELGTESRAFAPDNSSQTYAGNFAVTSRLRLDVEHSSDSIDELSARVRFFTRLDAEDNTRRLIVPEELFVNLELEPLQLRIGYQMLNWSATEAFHPADIINSRILDGSFENPEKLGELMVSARVDIPGGNVQLFAMPRFVAPVMPSANSPLNFAPPGQRLGKARVLDAGNELSDEYWQPQWGIQISQTLGNADISLHLVRQIDRQLPLIAFDPQAPAGSELHPVYQAVTQVGGTYTQVFDKTLFKLEAAYRDFARVSQAIATLGEVPERDHVIMALGIERVAALTQSTETSFLLEAQGFLPTIEKIPLAAQPLFQHDVLVGARHSLNDEHSTSFLATAIIDLVNPEQVIAAFSLSRRLGDVWNMTVGGRLFFFPPQEPTAAQGFENLHGQHQLYLNLKRYF